MTELKALSHAKKKKCKAALLSIMHKPNLRGIQSRAISSNDLRASSWIIWPQLMIQSSKTISNGPIPAITQLSKWPEKFQPFLSHDKYPTINLTFKSPKENTLILSIQKKEEKSPSTIDKGFLFRLACPWKNCNFITPTFQCQHPFPSTS